MVTCLTISQAQDRESLLVKDQSSTTMLRRQLMKVTLMLVACRRFMVLSSSFKSSMPFRRSSADTAIKFTTCDDHMFVFIVHGTVKGTAYGLSNTK